MKPIIIALFLLPMAMTVHAQSLADSTHPEIFRYVEQMPTAGYNISEFLGESLVYPRHARKTNKEGKVTVKFIVTETGRVDSAHVISGFDEECDAEALRVVTLMPPWKPGKQNGKFVKVYFTLPITFKLED